MKRCSVAGANALAVFALCAVAVAATSAFAAAGTAPHWQVGSTVLTSSSQTEGVSGTSTTEVHLESAALSLKNPSGDCEATGTAVGSAAKTPGTAKEVVLKCTNVKVVGAETTCTVHSPGEPAGTVATNKLKATLVWLNAARTTAGALFTPESGTQFVELDVEGASCPVSHTKPYEVTGEEVGQGEPVGKTEKTGKLLFPATPFTSYFNNEESPASVSLTNPLKLGKVGGTGGAATFRGNFSLTANSGQAVGLVAD